MKKDTRNYGKFHPRFAAGGEVEKPPEGLSPQDFLQWMEDQTADLRREEGSVNPASTLTDWDSPFKTIKKMRR